MEIKINLNETVKVKLTDYGKDVYYHQFDDLNKRIIKNGGKPIEPHFPKEDENGYCEMQLWGLMDLYGNYMAMEHQNVFKPFQIIYECELKENESLKVDLAKCSIRLDNLYKTADEIKSEAIKEFAKRLIEKCYEGFRETDEMLSPYVTDDDIDNLVKEMTEVSE